MAKEKISEENLQKKKFLNVGGGNKNTAIPDLYNNWEHLLLDIDKSVEPDVLCDARELTSRPAAEFDAIYCSHNLEHYLRHEGLKVLKGFLHVLKEDGFVHIKVPDIQQVMRTVIEKNLDIGDVLYPSSVGPITVRDVMYGYEKQIEETGQDYYAHKTGFSPKSLQKFLFQAGFPNVAIIENRNHWEIIAVAFKSTPSEEIKKEFNLK